MWDFGWNVKDLGRSSFKVFASFFKASCQAARREFFLKRPAGNDEFFKASCQKRAFYRQDALKKLAPGWSSLAGRTTSFFKASKQAF